MNQMLGSLAAQIIESLAKEEKDLVESRYKAVIEPAIRRELECPGSVPLPPRLVNGFMRSLNLSQDATKRIIDSLKLVAFAMANQSRDSGSQLPSWVDQLASDDLSLAEFHDDSDRATRAVRLVMDNIHKQKAVGDIRREANKQRSQASFIRGVCRTLDSTWLQKVTQDADQATRELLDRQRVALLQFPIGSADDLLRWSRDAFSHFVNLSDVGNRSSAEKSLAVSNKVFSNYEKAWESFCTSHAERILQQMEHQGQESDSALVAKLDSALILRQMASPEASNRDPREELVSYWSEFNQRVAQSAASLAPSAANEAPVGVSTYPSSPTARTETQDGHAQSDVLTILVKFRDPSGRPRSIFRSWQSVDDTIAELSEWYYTCETLIGNTILDLVRIEMYLDNTTQRFELEDVSLPKIELFFYQHITRPHWDAKFGQRTSHR